MVTIRETRST